MSQAGIEPRRRAAVDIKLLRLELVPRGRTPCETISHLWSPAQPTENLTPDAAAEALKVEVWAPQSVVKERYKKLQMRYPPEQFPDKHSFLRPASELLSDPVLRLNWYWQSALIPVMWSEKAARECPIWNHDTCCAPVSAPSALASLSQAIGKMNLS
jgi:hypothetical protein